MANNKLSSGDIQNIVNELIVQINGLIKSYSIPGILAILIGFGLVILLITYLPFVLGLLVVALLAYFGYQKLK